MMNSRRGNRHSSAVASFPCHTTVHAGPHTAVRRLERSTDSQSLNPKRVKVSMGQRDGECRTVRQPPRTMSAARGLRGQIFAHTPFLPFREPYRSPLPLLPNRRPEPASGPLLKTLPHRRRLTFPQITQPAPPILGQFLGHPFDAYAPGPSRQFPNLRLEPEHRFRRDPPLGFPDQRQISRGKLYHLPYAAAEFTPGAFDGYGLHGHLPARPTPYASDPVFVHRLVRLLHASVRRSLAVTSLRFAITSPPSGYEGDFHPRVV